MNSDTRRRARLVALALAGALALNYPVLALFSGNTLFFGMPMLYFYLFVCWGLFIALAAIATESDKPLRRPKPPREQLPPPQ